MKVGFISQFDVENKKAWSGTINFLYETLSKENELYPIVVKPTFVQKCFKKITKLIFGKNEDYTFIDQWVNRKAINKKIKIAIENGVECFFAPAASTLLGVSNIPQEYKVVYLSDVVKILFVGVEWKRKGTDLAIDCVDVLNHSKCGRKFELTIIGLDKPENYNGSDSVHFVGRLNKDNVEQYEKMIKFYQESDLFLLPTLAECSAIVFSEAAMYGLPTFTHNTGGVMSYVEDGVTGRGLQLGSTGEDFANAILDMLNKNQYDDWSKNARRKYEKELNWEKWLTSCKKIIEE